MQRRLFTLLAVLAPVAALAQTAPTAPTAPTSPAPTSPAAHRKLQDKPWAEMTRRQHERLLKGFTPPVPNPADAATRWDAMTVRQRRAVIRTARHTQS